MTQQDMKVRLQELLRREQNLILKEARDIENRLIKLYYNRYAYEVESFGDDEDLQYIHKVYSIGYYKMINEYLYELSPFFYKYPKLTKNEELHNFFGIDMLNNILSMEVNVYKRGWLKKLTIGEGDNFMDVARLFYAINYK